MFVYTTSLTRFNYLFYIFISVLTALLMSVTAKAQDLDLAPLGVYQPSEACSSAAEIVDYDPRNGHLVLVNNTTTKIEVLNIDNPAVPLQVLEIDYVNFGNHVQSIAVHKGIIAAAIEATITDTSGVIVFFDAAGEFLNKIHTETTPDLMSFTADGSAVLTAHRVQNSVSTAAERGTVTVVNLQNGIDNLQQGDIRRADFAEFSVGNNNPDILGLAIEMGLPIATDPSYLAIDKESKTGYVTLRDADNTGVIDINFETIAGLLGEHTELPDTGGVEHELEDFLSSLGAEIDEREASVYDDVDRFESKADYFEEEAQILSETRLSFVSEINRPDAVGRYRSGGIEYLVTANSPAGRNNPGAVRSFSIWDLNGTLMFDSSIDLEEEISMDWSVDPEVVEDSLVHSELSADSHKKAMVTGRIGDRTYLFMDMMYDGGIDVFDITDPAEAAFKQFIPLDTEELTADVSSGGDVSAASLFFIRKSKSPTHQPLLVVSSGDAGATAFYEIRDAATIQAALPGSHGDLGGIIQ